jgi:Spy/CpxP family protein refolding chaperone
MKTIHKIIIILTLASASVQLFSQNPGRFPQIRERIIMAKLQEIRKALNLDQATMDKFRPVYIQYEKEITGINIKGQERLMRTNSDSLTSEEAERLVLAQLDNTKKMLEIREKYYYKFKSVLTPQQIIKLYQTEAEIRRKVMQELRRRFGGRMNQ